MMLYLVQRAVMEIADRRRGACPYLPPIVPPHPSPLPLWGEGENRGHDQIAQLQKQPRRSLVGRVSEA